MKKFLNKILESKNIELNKIQVGKKNTTYLCSTDNGVYVIKFLTPQFLLKRTNVERFNQIYEILDRLNAMDNTFLSPLKNDRIKSVNRFGEKYFSVFKFIDNDNVKAVNTLQIQEMAKVLCQFHNLTKDLVADIQCDFEKYFKELFKNKKYRNFLCDYYTEYKNINPPLHNCLIHGDYAINNILFKDNSIKALIDFDYMSKGSVEEELIRSCRNFSSHQDKREFLQSYFKNCKLHLNITQDTIKKFIIKDYLNEVCVYYFQSKSKIKNKKQFKLLLKNSIKELDNINNLIFEIWEIIKDENVICGC